MRAREEHGRDHDVIRPQRARADDSPADWLLRLQQTSGNAAVSRLVQRKPKPKAHAPAGSPHKKSGALSIGEESFDRATLLGHAGDAYKAGDYAHAAALMERAYELQPARDLALNIYRCYQKLGDKEQADHWLAVHHGKAEGNEPPVEYQQF